MNLSVGKSARDHERLAECGRRIGGVSISLMLAATFASIAQAQQPEAPPQVGDPTAGVPEPAITLRPGQFVQRTETPSTSPIADVEMEKAFSATYVGADVNLVINAILGQFLQIPYTVAPDVQGTVTLGIEGVRTRSAGIGLLRSALQPLGIAVIDRGGVVAIVRAGTQQDGPVNAAVIEPGQPSPPGGGIAILIPRFAEPSLLGPLISPFSTASVGGSVVALADDKHRMLILRGDEQAIAAASKAAAMFDVDWFSQVSTATFTLQHVSPKDLISELKSVLGPAAGGVEFVAMPRLSQLIVFARRPETLTTLRDWVAKLDVTSAQITGGMLLYTARHMSAEELAESLQDTGPTDTSEVSPAMAASAVTPAGAAVSSPYSAPVATTGSATLPPGGKSGAMSVSTNARQNIVIVRGNSDQLAEARALLEVLDQPVAQVLIEAAIVEVTLNDQFEFGVNWAGLEDQLAATFSDDPSGGVLSRFPGLALSYVNVDIQVALNLLSSITHVEVVSRPSVVALNNETAELQVGDEVPIVTQAAVSVVNPDAPIVNQTTYRNTGVILNVTPRVRAGGVVELEVGQEVSKVARTTSSGIDSPTIQQRRIESRLLVPSGKSVALGGLISTTRTKGVTGVPLLKDVPLLGQLFRSNSDLVERTELIVFLTPRVMVEPQEAVEVTEQMRSAFRKMEADLARR